MAPIITRRQALGLVGGGLAIPVLRPAVAEDLPWWQGLPEARALVGEAVPTAEGILLDLPLLSEDGASVATGVLIDRPMTPELYVASLHLFTPANPSPRVADYAFSPLSGRAEIATRIRLNESQTVGAIAVMSDGEVLVAGRHVDVFTIGCFANPAAFTTDNVMFVRVRLGDPVIAGRPLAVTTMINHPMETGLRLDPAGVPIPRNMIGRFTASFARATVFEARFHGSTAVNPYLRFHFVPQGAGDLVLRWEDDFGRVAEERVAVRPA